MIAAGWSAKRVQAELGHADPAFTLRVYGHLFPDEFETGRQALDATIATALDEIWTPPPREWRRPRIVTPLTSYRGAEI